MAIDRIGKGGNIPQVSPSESTESTQKTGATFKVGSVERTDQAAPAGQVGQVGQVDKADAASPLARLRAGEVDVNGYVDLKVDEATKGIQGVSPADLAEIKNVLRDQMRTDPGLSDLVHTATGKMPSPPEE